jgi:hypothetical protein
MTARRDRRSGRTAAIWPVLVGPPLRARDVSREQITPAEGLSALSLDALTSIAYGPEAILAVLAVAGAGALSPSGGRWLRPSHRAVNTLNGQGWRQAGELGVALLLSAVIGLEREIRHKDAGLGLDHRGNVHGGHPDPPDRPAPPAADRSPGFDTACPLPRRARHLAPDPQRDDPVVASDGQSAEE